MTRKNLQERGSWQRLHASLLILFGCFILVSATELDLPSDNDSIGARAGGIGVYADEEDGGSSNSTGSGGGGRQSEATTVDQCASDFSNCCYQYTWTGYRETPPEGENATCAYLREEMKDDAIACYDPMVFTRKRGETPLGTPPDLDDLKVNATKQGWPIYCVKSGRSCIEYTHFSGNDVLNITRFCGRVSNQSSNKRIEEGCYKQKMGGGIVREVCVCTNNCNMLQSSSPTFHATSKLMWTTVITLASYALIV